MRSLITRSQDDIDWMTTKLSKIEQTSETTTSSKTQNVQIIKTSFKRDFTSKEDLNVNVQSNEYERFLTTKKKIEQIKKIQLLREQKDQEWSIIFILSLHSKNAERVQFESIFISVRDIIMRYERYLKIIKLQIYKNFNSQKLNIFIRICQIIFDVRFVFYKNNVHRINFVKFLLSNNVSELNKVWQRYQLRLDETTKFVFFESNSATFWKNIFISLSFESRSLSKRSSDFINEIISRLHSWLCILKL